MKSVDAVLRLPIQDNKHNITRRYTYIIAVICIVPIQRSLFNNHQVDGHRFVPSRCKRSMNEPLDPDLLHISINRETTEATAPKSEANITFGTRAQTDIIFA